MLDILRRFRADLPVSDAEWEAWQTWRGIGSSASGTKRKRKRRKRRLPKSSSRSSSGYGRSCDHQRRVPAVQEARCAAETGTWLYGTENCGCSAVAVPRWPSKFPFVLQRQILMVYTFLQTTEIFQLPLAFRLSMPLLCCRVCLLRSCRQRQFAPKTGYAGYDVPQLCSSWLSQAHDARHHGRYGPDGQLQ